MDLKKIKGLVEIIENSSLTEFTYSDENIDITMTKVDYAPGKQAVSYTHLIASKHKVS